ncbi:MAG: RNA polymerase factor sigma-54 [Pseudomonadota bacterium]
MKQSLQLKISQHLALTPQLQQSIRLLQLSTLELNQEIENFLQENPFLEREEEGSEGGEGAGESPLPFDTAARMESAQPEGEGKDTVETKETAAEDELSTPSLEANEGDWREDDGSGSYGGGDEGEDGEPPIAAGAPNLREHLLSQLGLTNLSERDKRLVALLIDALDEDGYLTQSLEEVAALLPPELEVELEDLQIALKHLQNFDPPGVGARNLAEGLTLQLENLPADTPHLDKALCVVKNHLDLLAARDFAKLKKQLHCDDACLRLVQNLITGLNPHPGASFEQSDTRYVVPDVIVRKIRGRWAVALNPDAMPRLRINRIYADILHRNRDATFKQLSGQLQEAKWLIKNVQQRFETILRVSQAIVDRQRHFFEHGEVAMRPLVLREIAEELGLHESTISRVTTQKFMMTPRGIFELKYFFGSHVSTEAGGAASSTAIRALIKQLVSAEDSKKPLTDSQIAEILAQQGLVVARRTVAKYRESLQILPVNLRKTI